MTIFYIFAVVLAACYIMFDTILATVDMVVNSILPIIIDILANILLIVRVLVQKYRLRQSVSWQQQRRMVFQLFCLSSFYLFAWIPFIVNDLLQTFTGSFYFVYIQVNYTSSILCIFFFLGYVSHFFLI